MLMAEGLHRLAVIEMARRAGILPMGEGDLPSAVWTLDWVYSNQSISGPFLSMILYRL